MDSTLAQTFTAGTAAAMAATGALSVSIAQGAPLTDTQIDALVAEWETRNLALPLDLDDAFSPNQSQELMASMSSSRFSINSSAAGLGSGNNETPAFERIGNMFVRGDTVLVGKAGVSNKCKSSVTKSSHGVDRSLERLSDSRSRVKGMSLRRSWDGTSREEVDHRVDELYEELDDVLSGLSESEGLTDDELKDKVDTDILIFFGKT